MTNFQDKSPQPRPIQLVDKASGVIKTFPSVGQAAHHLNCTPAQVRQVAKGRARTVKGHIATYIA